MPTELPRGKVVLLLFAVVAAAVSCAASARGEDPASLAHAIFFEEGDLWTSLKVKPASAAVETPSAQLALTPVADDGSFPSPVDDTFCNTCGEGGGGFAELPGGHNRCGCDQKLFPWFTGPGNCDTWCIGPHWNVEFDGMFIRREDANWGDVAGVDPADADQFDYGPGARLFVTGYNYSNYGLQIGYEGVNDFHALAATDDGNPNTGESDITYESRFNSLEVDVLRRTDMPLKVFAGFRYVQLDEDFLDVEQSTGNDYQDANRTKATNRMPGFQIGVTRDAWQLNRWITIEPFGNVGGYLNDFKREFIEIVDGAYTTEKNEFTEMAFIGEAGVTSVLRINRCLALRGGYQVIAFDGVGTALDASLAGLNGQPTFDRETLIYHGARFGLEYQR